MKIKELFIIFGMLNTLLLFSCISKPNKEDSADSIGETVPS